MGRKQPYVGFTRNWVGQCPTSSDNTQPQHTFFRHNNREKSLAKANTHPPQTLDEHFYWPVHLDRRLVNPLELLNVSCYRPWEFTQKFGTPNDHRAPWDRQETLLYRLLEGAQAFTLADAPGGRVTGKININTIWDPEILDALVDSPYVNTSSLFKALMDSRSPGVLDAAGGLTTSGNPGAADDIDFAADGVTTPGGQMNRPIKSLNVGVYDPKIEPQYPNGLGRQNTILRTGLFEQPDNLTKYPGGFPFKKNEVLTKIFNNVTTRSNVFAVWLTAGFFEVVDESVLPVKLGAEIGRAENRHIRHRMFAIVDRTNLMTPDPKTAATTPAAMGPKKKVSLNQVTWNLASSPPGQVNVKPVSIKPGMKLTFEPSADPNDPKMEIVTVLAVDYGLSQITASFTKNHKANVPVTLTMPAIPTTPGPVPGSLLGNPGPQEGFFDPRQNSLVVPHFSIIQ